MNILLFSDDETLADFCRETVVEMFGPESKLEVGIAGQGNFFGFYLILLAIVDNIKEESVKKEEIPGGQPQQISNAVYKKYMTERDHPMMGWSIE